MAANLRHVFTFSKLSRQFSKCLHAKGRLFSVLALRRSGLPLQNPSFCASSSTIECRRLHVGPRKNTENSEYVDPEFVTEEFPLPSEKLKDVGELISRIKYV